MVRTVTTAFCHACDWTAPEGEWAAVDKAAEKHTVPGHPTSTETRAVR